MEGIIKLEMRLVGRYISKENLYGALLVLTGVILLCLYVESSSVRYYELRTEKKTEAKSSIYMGGIHAGDKELYSDMTKGMAKNADLLNYRMDMNRPGLNIAGYAAPGRITDEADETRERSWETNRNGTIKKNPAAGNLTVGNPTIDNPAADSPAENNPAADIPAIDNPPEAKPAKITVTVYGNGGAPEVLENIFPVSEFTAELLGTPKRPGKLFAGWYKDAEGTIPFEGLREGETSLELYAHWSEFPGFLSNDLGHIIACTGEEEAVFGGLLVLPSHESCTGVERGAFDGQVDLITDVYIPANITYIESGVFDGLTDLMYIQVEESNPVYSSIKGILYDKAGNVIAYPAGRTVSY